MFTPIDGSSVILFKGGIYRQALIMRRKMELYAKISGGFIRLMAGGFTSYGDMKWSDIELPDEHILDDVKSGGLKLAAIPVQYSFTTVGI